jgi:hypothetical protein
MGDLSSLITEVSRLASSEKKPKAFVQGVRTLLEEHLHASRVRIAIHSAVSEATLEGTPSFLFSRVVAVRGVEYGTLQVDLRQPEHAPHLLLVTLETIAWQVALFAERVALTEENARLTANREAIAAEIGASKIVSRAAGVVARLHSLPFDAASAWLQAEANRARRPLADIAERVLLFQDSQDRLVSPLPIRRSA